MRRGFEEGRFGSTAGAGERFGRGGFFTAPLGDLELAIEHLEDGLALYRQVGDRRGVATCLRLLGTTMFELGDWERAEALLEEGLALARESGSIQPGRSGAGKGPW